MLGAIPRPRAIRRKLMPLCLSAFSSPRSTFRRGLPTRRFFSFASILPIRLLLTRPAQAHEPLAVLEGLPAAVAAINAVVLHYQVPPGTGGTVVARPPGRCWKITVGMRGISQLLFEESSAGVPTTLMSESAVRGVGGAFWCKKGHVATGSLTFRCPLIPSILRSTGLGPHGQRAVSAARRC